MSQDDSGYASRSALLDGIEWNVRLNSRTQMETVSTFQEEFEYLYHHCSVEIDDVMLRRYSLHYRKPEHHAPFDPPLPTLTDFLLLPLPSVLPIQPSQADAGEPHPVAPVEYGKDETNPEMARASGNDGEREAFATGVGKAGTDEAVITSNDISTPKPKIKPSSGTSSITRTPISFLIPQPNDPQTEALYALRHTREFGNGKALVVAATGVGKTYLAAFDSVGYGRVLFLAHREELLIQAEQAFRQVRPMDSTGFYTGEHKDMEASLLFASVQTLGELAALQGDAFPHGRFDYVVIDEFHHAASKSYRKIIEYFKPDLKILVGDSILTTIEEQAVIMAR